MKRETGISLDVLMTGQVLGNRIRKSGYTVSEIQKELKLSCPQPIYRWMNGQTLPSIDNLYRLSEILDVHMEELVLARQDEIWVQYTGENPDGGRRLVIYYRRAGQIYQKRKY